MKIKKFKNLWLMGILLMSLLLIGIYLLKFICPSFVVGVAETEWIVRVGEYVDTHEWAYYLLSSIFSFIAYYLICCICCRVKKLNLKECCIIIFTIALLFLAEKYTGWMYQELNIISQLLLPMILTIFRKGDVSNYYSTVTCISIHFLSQAFSLQIREIVTMISRINYATLMVLLIDGYIWLILLYLLYNYKEIK